MSVKTLYRGGNVLKGKKKICIIIAVIFAAVISLGSIGYLKSDIHRKKVFKKKLYDASQKTIQYYYDSYKPKQFAGILDWPALGLYGFGEDVSSKVWTADGKNGAYWREAQVKNGDGLSEVKNTDYQRTLIGITSANKNPRNFGGIDFVKTVESTMLPDGHFADSVKDRRTGKPIGEDLINAQCFGIIGLHSAGMPIANRDKAIRWMEKNQHIDGGFTWDVKDYDDKEDYKKVVSDVDMTAAVLMSMSILKVDKDYPVVKRALDFIRNQQEEDGGFASWGVENPESTVWACQALLMYGENPESKAWEKKKNCNPVDFLLKYELPNGAFTHVLSKKDELPVYDNNMTTYEALYGMADLYNCETTYDKLFKANKETSSKLLFSDFKEGDYGYKEAVQNSYNYVMDTYSDGTFKPSEKITKGSLARYLVNVLDFQSDFYQRYSGDEMKFINENKKSDVMKIDSDDNYIELCLHKGLFKDIPELNAEGDREREIKCDEIISALINGGKLKGKDLNSKQFASYGFSTNKTADRAECAVALSRFENLIK